MSVMSGIERVSVDLTPVKECLKPVVWVIGGPGTGRTTQCEYLQAKHGWVHISSGVLLRQEVTITSSIITWCNLNIIEGHVRQQERNAAL